MSKNSSLEPGSQKYIPAKIQLKNVKKLELK